jgi:predicted acylesterase/phospholipase RssA
MGAFFNAVARWWRNWMAARAGVAMLNCCGAEETERIAHDVGVSASELRALAGKWPDSAELLNHRLIVLGLDPGEIGRSEPQVLADLQRVCTMCTSTGECAHHLARNPSDPIWREYCPNVMTLDALKAERARSAKTT